ncbi:ribonuclease P protein component [Thermoleptolyngbya oregonensis NK1-22]|uniref:Ribonuclease P protein component n=1 Tax=Thermoleptolyngbya oregonensis NK1-22 TaxID=2547457 RepID=A0AA96Y0R0_9CYAN|nr:ribonuclease P protein component [Thermoleptolyngbya oregonensis]WOB41867.1 ribonuclease P protein component [Thermoleptolyngbya oregonensis NK1-22]
MALPKVHRLKRRQEFSKVYQAGVRRSTRNFTLRALRQFPVHQKKPGLPDSDRSDRNAVDRNAVEPLGRSPTRIGITVSTKVSKRAVVRNRIKRRIRAALRELLPGFATGWMIVVIVQPVAVKCNYKEILQELKQLLIEAEVFDGHSGRCVL